MTETGFSPIEQKILAIVDRLVKKNQFIKIKDLFAIAKKELKFDEVEIERAIWSLVSKKYIVDGKKFTKETILANKKRQEILKFIINNPGANVRAVRGEMDTGAYLTSWHLQMLQKFGYIWKKSFKNQILIFPYLIKESDYEAFIVLKDEKSFAINEFIFERETITVQDVMKQFDLNQGTAQSYLDNLLSTDLIDFKEEDGVEIYWGNMEKLKPILEYWQEKDKEIQRLVAEIPEVTKPVIKEEVPAPVGEKLPELVEAKREYDYLGGNIRFKIAVRNNSQTMISKIRVMLTPTDQFKYETDIKSLETLSPNESRGVDFLLTPMTCGKSQVFGTISYVDAYGKPKSFTVDPKEIWVKCPLVTSVKAEMKELLEWQSGLQSGMSSISFEGLSKQTAFQVVSDQISALDLALVTSDDEALKGIYSGLAKVTNTKIIVEIETYEDAVKLAVWASDLNQVTGFLAYIKNLVNIALGMSKTLRMKEVKLGEKVLNAFEFVERLIQLFEYCESNWELSEVVILLKEITRRIQRDLPSLPIDINRWVAELEEKVAPEASLWEKTAIKLEYDTMIYLEKVSDLIKSNLEMYKSAFQDDTKIVPMIEEKYQNLLDILRDVEKKYSKRIMKFLLVIDNTSGLTMYQHSFAKSELDSDLISGFLTAIQSFGVELSTDGISEMKKLAYKDFEIELNIGDYIRAALFLSGEASKYLVRNLVIFINNFEKKYELSLKDWHGDVSLFDNAKELVEKSFN